MGFSTASEFCREFREILESSDTQPLLLPPRSPNLISYVERFFNSLKSKGLDRMIFFNEASLRRFFWEFRGKTEKTGVSDVFDKYQQDSAKPLRRRSRIGPSPCV